MKRRYLVDSIVQEYRDKQKYQKKAEVDKFRKENCTNCKNKKTYNCNITRNEKNELFCAFKDIDIN